MLGRLRSRASGFSAIVVGHKEFIFISFDVSQAFAKGLAFEELSRLTGTGCRAVPFDVPSADLHCLKQIKGLDNFNPQAEALTMLKPIYGPKDAPRAWRKTVHQVLESWQQCQQLYAEPELYCVHKNRSKRSRDPIGRAQAHNFEQQEVAEPRVIVPSSFVPGNLQCLLPVHVDDIKGTAPKEVADPLLKLVNDSVGQPKADFGAFLNIGIQHEHSPGEVFIHQCVYVGSIQPIKTFLHQGKDDEALCDGFCHGACRSVLGAVAWTVLTRVELAVYVQALQRRAHAPGVTGCKRLNLVIRYMEKHKCGLKSVNFKHPLKLVGFIDAAFKAQPDVPIGLALGGGAATLQEDSRGSPIVLEDWPTW